MEEKSGVRTVPEEIIVGKILLIRNKKVMIDRDLAELYGVTTKQMNQQVKRNLNRFPKDFMFQLTAEEKEEVVTNCDHLKSLKYSPVLPYVFTEHGAVMLASVVNSERAIAVNILIVRIFTQMREMLLTHKDILLKLEQLERKATERKRRLGISSDQWSERNSGHDDAIQIIFKYLKQLLNPPQEPRPRIGFRRADERE
jgi:hypothetical protein